MHRCHSTLAVLAISILLTFAGCAAPRINTPSGRPEVTIPGVTTSDVATALANRLIPGGWTITNSSAFALVAEKPSDDPMASALFGSNFNGTPNYRVRFSMAAAQGSVRLFGVSEIVSNPGSGFERSQQLTGKHLADIQRLMEGVREQLGGAPATQTAVEAKPTAPIRSPE